MIAGGRLKLGPKRKDSGFHRLHKLHQEAIDSENVDIHKLTLLDKQTNHHDSKETGKERQLLQLGSPRNHLHLISNTPNIDLGPKSKVSYEVVNAPMQPISQEN